MIHNKKSSFFHKKVNAVLSEICTCHNIPCETAASSISIKRAIAGL